MATRGAFRAAPLSPDQILHFVEIEDASGDRFLFTDQGGSWHAFDSNRDNPPAGARAIFAKIPVELTPGDPDNELVAVILAKRFHEGLAKGEPMTQQEINRIASRSVKLAKRLPQIVEDGRRGREDSALTTTPATTGGSRTITPLAVAGWIGIPVLGYVVYRIYKKRFA
jgi:hypothetical protein